MNTLTDFFQGFFPKSRTAIFKSTFLESTFLESTYFVEQFSMTAFFLKKLSFIITISKETKNIYSC